MGFGIDWHSTENRVLINPRFPLEEREEILNRLGTSPPLSDHFWMATSGSTSYSKGEIKWTALSKEAILASAKAVNEFLECTCSDIWLNPLPFFHVGGLGIFARAFLSNSPVVDAYNLVNSTWNVHQFYELLHQSQASLTSLVPAQVFDLVTARKRSPPALRAVVVGGGALSEEIFFYAKENGWPLLPSYGLTECASQVATASFQDASGSLFPKMTLLPHIQAYVNPADRLVLKSSALFTLYAIKKEAQTEFIDPKVNGWFETEDLAEIDNGKLKIQGRLNHFVKIGGESVDILRLEGILDGIKAKHACVFDMALFPMPELRLGHVIHLAVKIMPENLFWMPSSRIFNARYFLLKKFGRCISLSRFPERTLGKSN